MPWLPWARVDHGRAETRRYLRAARAAWSRQTAFEFVIELRETASASRASRACTASTGCAPAPASATGYAARSGARASPPRPRHAALAHALGGLRLHRVEALVALENKASQRVIEKLGFTREGVAREAEYVDGRYLDHIQYSFLHG